MRVPELIPNDAPDVAFIAAVDAWAALLEAEDYQGAFDITDHVDAMEWTPDLIREVIKSYGEADPGQRVTVAGKPNDIRQRKNVRRFPKNKAEMVGEVWYDLNINGLASDLTALFGIRAKPMGLVLTLDDIHVM